MPFVVASTTIDKIQNTHIGNKPPIVPTTGQLWNDTTQQPPLLKMWNGTDWELVHTSIKQLDPVAFEDINKMIDDAISGAEQDRNKIQEAIDKANDALQQAGLNNTEITAIKQIQSEDGEKINQIQINYNGLQESVKDLDNKTESYHTQLAGQINDVVKEQGNLSQQIQTAESNISSVQDSQNNMNRELQTAKETINQISSKTESNTELINTVKQTSDSNSQKIVDTSGKVSIVEQTLNEQKQTIIDNTGKINQAVQDIDSANRTISNIDGRVSRVEQKADGITTTVSRVETELNDKADTSYVDNKVNNIQIGGTNILLNTDLMNNESIWSTDGNVVVNNGVATIQGAWASRDYSCDVLNEYIQKNNVENKKYILSVDIMRSSEEVLPDSKINFYCESSGSNETTLVSNLSELPLNKWMRCSIPIVLLGNNVTNLTGKFRIECNTNTEWKFRHMKLEEGTKPTDWSPSPSDVSKSISELSKGSINCWLNSNFYNGYEYWIKNINHVKVDTNEEYNGSKVLHMTCTDGADWEYIGTKRYKVKPGEKISFGWLQNKASGDLVYGELQLYPNENDSRNGWVPLNLGIINEWTEVSKEGYVVPGNVNYVSFNFYINDGGESKYTQFQLVHSEKLPPYQPSVNDLNDAQLEINQQLQSQQTQINQKPDRTEIIASSNENPRAYFKVGTFSDGPNIGKGYVSVGADYGFFLNTNTFISDGFTLSANNISAGSIHGNKLSWADDIDTPSYFKDNDGKATKPILNLKVGNTANDEFYLAGVSSERSLIENDSRYSIIGTSYSQSQLSFRNLDWQKGKENNDTLHQSKPGFIKGKYSPVNKECTGIELRSGGSALVIEDVYARDQLNTTNEFAKYVQVGKDFDGYPCLSTPSIYTDYIMSSKGEANKGVTFYDRLNLTEGIYSAWDKSGKKTYIDFPSENGGDTITFHTAEGEGAYGDWHSYFKMTNGNWSTGGIANQHHAIVVGGDGYILSFSNEEGDNAQGNANATVVASRFVTNSSRALKEDIKPIDNIEQATQDILKIEPKQYLYKDQAEKIKQWKENGKPADEFKHIDTRINIGLIAEDLDEYESLQPFIEKVSDEEGNEGILGIDYSKLTPLLLAVCRRQDDKINKLEERLVRMELLMKDLHK